MRATRALAGYPGLWTTIPTKKGKKRMKILEVSLKQNNQLVLEVVRIEGQNTAKWSEVKNGVIN